MPEPTDLTSLDSCGCCDTELPTPAVENPPGQPALNYRIGTHQDFMRRMLARLSKQEIPDGDNAGQRPLVDLTARTPDDPAIAMLDGWATVAHVLTFYQERIANEGYLRTATERRSILELARAIGYELAPGVAAEAYLAFLLDDNPQTPDETIIAAGTQVQSIPTEAGELPQTFETMADFNAKVWWNALRPQLSRPQEISLTSSELYLKGANLNVAAGDRMLLVSKDNAAVRKRVRAVKPNSEQDYTLVTFEPEPNVVVAASPTAVSIASAQVQAQSSALGFNAAFNAANVESLLSSTPLAEHQFQAILNTSGWKIQNVLDYASTKIIPANATDIEVFILREKAGIFGHNAPHFNTLSTEATDAFYEWDSPSYEVWRNSVKEPSVTPTMMIIAAFAGSVAEGGYYEEADLYLERPITGIREDSPEDSSWLLLERPGDYQIYRVRSAAEGSLTGFGMSAKVTGLELADIDGNVLDDTSADKDANFKVRKTTAYVKSEKLEPAFVPVTTPFPAGAVELPLDRLTPGLQVGQPVALTGEQDDAPGVLHSEVKFLDAITHDKLFTTLKFSEGLKYSYKRDSVIINANVVRATHGETVAGEVLGSGDGAQTNQRFKLKKPPLTYLSAATASGAESTLSVRVNGLEWQQVPSLYGLDGKTRAYIVRLDDDANTYIIFGDGKRGARLPTGQENITATYRSGIGSVGEVDTGTLTLLKKRPFGVRSVTNPTEASGAADPEKLDEARVNAPLTVLTLERIVSLQDYEDFARAFAGIGKAQAVIFWNGETELVHLTIASASGDPVESASDLFKNLRDAINAARDPLRLVEMGSFQPHYFNLEAKVQIEPAYRWEDVKSAIEVALKASFSFASRAFGQPVTAAEIINIIHNLQGVVAVDLEKLYLVGETGQPVEPLLSSLLQARTARPNPAPTTAVPQRFLPAELLLINEAGITLIEMTTVT